MNMTTLFPTDQHEQHYVPSEPPQRPPKQPKALRFVTNYGAPHPKRRRVGAACLTCRKRKTACSGERPTCETCKQNKLECAGYSAEKPATPGQKRHPSDRVDHSFAVDDTDNRRIGSSSRKYHSHATKVDPSLRGLGDDGEEMPRQGFSIASPRAGSPRNSDRLSQRQGSDSGADRANSLFPRPRDRMPYFRWLGPTAIMPGFKQMVVKVKRQEADPMARSSTNGEPPGRRSPSTNDFVPGSAPRMSNQFSSGQTPLDSDARGSLSLPFYDTSPMPPSELITHLAHTFFTHLGCNYPFLQRERFLRDLEEKQVDAILVDAVCALAARFSTHPLLTSQQHLPPPEHPGQDEEDRLDKSTPAEYGHVFAQRAKTALVDTFACPSVAAVQAALLLAYLEFGESRDSGLWMYLGISIRMAQDLGLHTVEGLKYKGMGGPTPKLFRRESSSDSKKLPTLSTSRTSTRTPKAEEMNADPETVAMGSCEPAEDGGQHDDNPQQIEEQKAVEQERMDTFWAVFFLDRVVSSGTGRRSTLIDKDIELSFPALEDPDLKEGWPAPFPALIRIIHLYGRVADLLNGIKEPSDITSDTSKRLAAMESQVTHFYQGLSERLHFDAVNFQHYMKAGEGTNFVLLHFWFHTLIVLLHQPTLLKTFEGKMLQLFPNSQQLSMSSAKTIADILSYSQLIDAKASLGNPFTSQPIYIAACAFLKETAEQTSSSSVQSRASSPVRKQTLDSRPTSQPDNAKGPQHHKVNSSESNSSDAGSDDEEEESQVVVGGPMQRTVVALPSSAQTTEQQKSILAKHTLLATAATQHYQLCYKALQSLETYWAGAKYILTILDQKFEGVEDPLLYTIEESESSMERPRPVPEFKSPGWRRNLVWDPSMPGAYLAGPGNVGMELAQSPFWKARRASLGDADPSKAIGWTLTGTINSPSTNLAWHYPSGNVGATQTQQIPNFQPFNNGPNPGFSSSPLPGQEMQYPQQLQAGPGSSNDPRGPDSQMPRVGLTSYPRQNPGLSNVDAADLLLGLNNPYQTFRNPSPASTAFSPSSGPPTHTGAMPPPGNIPFATTNPPNLHTTWMTNPTAMQPLGDMMIESQDVDMSMLGLDMMPWFDSYPTHDLTGMLDPHQLGDGGNPARHVHGPSRSDGSGTMHRNIGSG